MFSLVGLQTAIRTVANAELWKVAAVAPAGARVIPVRSWLTLHDRPPFVGPAAMRVRVGFSDLFVVRLVA